MWLDGRFGTTGVKTAVRKPPQAACSGTCPYSGQHSLALAEWRSQHLSIAPLLDVAVVAHRTARVTCKEGENNKCINAESSLGSFRHYLWQRFRTNLAENSLSVTSDMLGAKESELTTQTASRLFHIPWQGYVSSLPKKLKISCNSAIVNGEFYRRVHRLKHALQHAHAGQGTTISMPRQGNSQNAAFDC
jgi:hypothetical protein